MLSSWNANFWVTDFSTETLEDNTLAMSQCLSYLIDVSSLGVFCQNSCYYPLGIQVT